METTRNESPLGRTIREAREAKGLSTRALGLRIGTTHSYIHKLEAGWFRTISPENIQALAAALDLDPQDLFALAGYRVPEGLPSFTGYLRTKYGEDLSDDAIARMSAYFEFERSQQLNRTEPTRHRPDPGEGRRP
ncbi:MAG: helix-turn-helix transcriptional regulator [Acidimicrobiales bacterium]|nr:helix-turn-helix transcriptional regulator [Acidimicrobiales bacterium]